MTAAEIARHKREWNERHLVDRGNPSGTVALCGRKVPFPGQAFLPSTKKNPLCVLCAKEAETVVRLVGEMEAKKDKQGPSAAYAEAERRRLRVRPPFDQLARFADVQEMGRMPSKSPCGGGWRK